ncbi:LOW QUALITY PROTEIN: fibroblast growth factor 1-like [Limulus polyphemus]|uniref:LOW QUALITY PROTEIN: fibroblast growth factor 1-like n=1 Tax=Limulus polyphemus TaxID=6850 RepID=A0ABM1T5U5_LIMPO|nr:LOW QUALITY PROTEIN: fibroblast growth factor 1-like [Limulus polyphemus]
MPWWRVICWCCNRDMNKNSPDPKNESAEHEDDEASCRSSYKLLYNKHGFFLSMDTEGNIFGTKEKHKHANFNFLTSDGEGVRIKAVSADKYVAMDEQGNLYGQDDPNSDETLFIENIEGYYLQYQSKNYQDWFIGIKKTGKPKKGTKTKSRQRAVMWLKTDCS